MFVGCHVLHEEQLFPDRGLEQALIGRAARAELVRLEFFHAIVKAPQPGQLRIDRKPRVFENAAVVFVETEFGRVKRPGREITADEFVGDDIELGIGFECGSAAS